MALFSVTKGLRDEAAVPWEDRKQGFFLSDFDEAMTNCVNLGMQ
jgi:hypothetical protein